MNMTNDKAQAILAENFAPWIQALGLQVTSVGPREATLRLPHDARLERVGATVCGQALMAAADTAMVIAISAALGGFRPMATVGQTISFFRPVAGRDTLVTARVIKMGRTLVFGEIEMRGDGADEPAAHATTTYALAG
ncbi:MAG TPA: PaaI family thioesterase [Rhodocyclaceae bacterium]|nr:PaaI family thioesterase [Rhodocyclaceae bacterium]